VDVAHELEKVGLFFDEYRLVPIAEDGTASVKSIVEPARKTGVQRLHQSRQRILATPKDEMDVRYSFASVKERDVARRSR
jgi:hypothetical protein